MDWDSLAASALSGAMNQLGGLASSAVGSQLGYANSKKLLKEQNKYALEAWQRNNERQEWLLKNINSLQKQSLRNAGYSTADPNGTGTSAPSVTPFDTPKGSFTPVSVGGGLGIDFVGSQLLKSQLQLNKSLSKEHLTNVEKLQQDIDFAKQQFPETLANLKANTQNLVSQKELNEHQAKNLDKAYEQMDVVIQGLRIDNNFKSDMSWAQINQMVAQTALLLKEGRIKEAEAKLADKGILLGADGLTTLISCIANGKADDVINQLANGLAQLLGALPSAIKTFFDAMIDQGKSGAFDGVRNFFNNAHQVNEALSDNENEFEAEKRDEKYNEDLKDSNYEAMTSFIRKHAKRDKRGNISDDEWEYWADVYNSKH